MKTRSSQAPAAAPETNHRKLRLRRWVAAAGLAGALALAAAGCGGGSSAASGATSQAASSGGNAAGTGSSDSAQQAGIAYAQCMRAHGVSDYPDNAISSSGGGTVVRLPKGITAEPDYKTAQQACQSKLPKGANAGGPASNARVQAEIKWANCMHSHGVPNAPEPNSQGAMILNGGSGGVDPNSPTFQAAMQACRHFLPNGGAGVGGS